MVKKKKKKKSTKNEKKWGAMKKKWKNEKKWGVDSLRFLIYAVVLSLSAKVIHQSKN